MLGSLRFMRYCSRGLVWKLSILTILLVWCSLLRTFAPASCWMISIDPEALTKWPGPRARDVADFDPGKPLLANAECELLRLGSWACLQLWRVKGLSLLHRKSTCASSAPLQRRKPSASRSPRSPKRVHLLLHFCHLNTHPGFLKRSRHPETRTKRK